MSDIDEKKPTGKAGKRKRNADQRRHKSDHKAPPKTDQPNSAAQIAPVLTASVQTTPIAAKAAKTKAETKPDTIFKEPTPIIAAVEPVPVTLQATEVQADTAILAAESVAVAAHHASEPSAPIVSTAPVAAQVSEPPAAPVEVTTVDIPAVDMAPIARPKVEETVALTATPMPAEAAPAQVAEAPVSLQTIANAYGDYTRKSLEQTKCFLDKLTGVRSIEQAVEIQTEFAKQTCETFVAQAQKISELHRELARQRFERMEGFMTLGTPTLR